MPDAKTIPTVPANLEAERSVLGAMLLSNDAWPQIQGLLEAHFFLESHRRIFRCMAEMVGAHVAAGLQPGVDLVTLAEELSKREELERIGGCSYIASLTDGLPRLANITHYVNILEEKRALREAIATGLQIADEAAAGPENVKKFLQSLKGRVSGAKPKAKKAKDAPSDGDWKEFWTEEDGLHTHVESKYGLENVRICAPLEVAAVTCDEHGEAWGRLLKWTDRDGREHSWAMPMQLLAGDGQEFRKSMLNGGFDISTQKTARDKLLKYISEAAPEQRGLSVTKVGWHGDVFVLPDTNIGGDPKQLYFYQPPQETWHNIWVQGTAEEWRECVGKFCSGNSRLVLAVSCAFAAVLLGLTDSESGGFHFYGDSSKGKSTAQTIAGSVWGGGGEKGYLESWRTTANGLEIFAEIHNDGLGCLDEIGEIDARQLGEAVYMLANGQGKGRMNKNIGSRKRLTWRILFLSSGNVTLNQHMESAGHTTHTALEVRLISITADAGAHMGMFEHIHGLEDSKAFAESLVKSAYKVYGAPIREFIKHVAGNRVRIAGSLRQRMESFARDAIPAKAPSEIRRAGRRFGLAVAAGELATDIGLTGWQMNEVAPMVKKCLDDWMHTREPNDTDRGVRAVRQALEMHGASRFQDVKASENDRIVNRAGYRRPSIDQEGIEYLIFPEVFRSEVCRGFDWRAVANELKLRDLLVSGSEGELTKSVYISGFGQHRFVIIKSEIMD